jgi:hypothetical protein
MKRKAIRRILTLASIALLFAPILLPGPRGPHWSIDLVSYGFHLREETDGRHYMSSSKVAASENVVALVMNNLAPGSQIGPPGREYAKTRWNYALLLFDANNGKLLARGGPWTADLEFDLFASSKGNFILDLHNYQGPGEKNGETLLLFSPEGKQLNELDLPPELTNSQGHVWTALISPARNTVLVSLSDGDMTRYKVLDANTLEERFEGTQRRSDPAIVAISDEQMLGAMPSAKPSSLPVTNQEHEFYIRTFQGTWRHLMDSATDFVFLSDHLMAGLEALDDAKGFIFTVSTTDGTRIMSYSFQKHDIAISGGGRLVQSSDGARVGCIFVLDPQAWLWRQLDMGPETSEIYIWAPPNPTPIFNLKVKSQFENFSFSPGGSWLAVADQRYLRAVPLPKSSDPKI